jgi:hypothetical protein
MSRDDPVQRLSRAAESAEAAAEGDPRVATFARGLVLGALVGAAIAGSTIWQRRHRRAKPETPATPITEPATADRPSDRG